MKSVIENIVIKKITKNLESIGSNIESITQDTDLLRTGIIDSMEFIELLTEIEEKTGVSIENLLEEEELIISIKWFLQKF